MRTSLKLIVMFVVTAAAGIAAQERVYTPGDGVTRPRLVADVKPSYTPEAMRARVEGEIGLEAVVGTDGKPSAVRVTKSLDTEHGLDASAVAALEQWVFTPGLKDGDPVPVKINVQMTFTLRK